MPYFATIITTWDGDEMHEPAPAGGKNDDGSIRTVALTLGSACRNALNAVFPDERPGLEEQIKRANLCAEIRAAEKETRPLHLVAEDIALIKRLISRIGYSPWVVGQVVKMIDPGERAAGGAS